MTMDIYDYAEKKKISIRQVLDFTLLSNPLGPSNKARSAMRSALKTSALFPDEKARHLRRYMARKEQIEADNIVFGHGSTPLFDLLLGSIKPGKVLVPGPLPRHYAQLFEKHRVGVVSAPLKEENGFPLDLDRFLPLIGDAAMLLVPNPHWLTGTLISPSDLNAIEEKLRDSGKLLVLDEGLMEFVGQGYPAGQAARSENVLVVRSFSFYHALAGLRLGCAFGNARLLDRLFGGTFQGPISAVAAAGAISSLKDGGFQKRTQEFLKAEKAYLIDRLGRISGIQVMDTQCNFLLVRAEQGSLDLKGLSERHFLLEGFSMEAGTHFIRVAVRGHRENARFAKTLARMLFLAGKKKTGE